MTKKDDYELIAATLRRIETLYHLDQSLAAGIRLEFANDLQRTKSAFQSISVSRRSEGKAMTREELETALDRGMLQGRAALDVKWYDIRRNGQTKTWKRDPNRIEIPCKTGFKNCFTLRSSIPGEWNVAIRVRPDNFDPRKRI